MRVLPEMDMKADFPALKNHDLPVLSTLEGKLHAASFTVMKLLAARAIIEDGIAKGRIKPGTLVVESTSGTFGLALAMLRPYYGYELTLVSDPVVDAHLRMRLGHLGADLQIVDAAADGSYQINRLARVREIMEANPDAFFANQYHNPVNLRGYARLADYLSRELGPVDCLIGAVGTGGSMCGTALRLREKFPRMKLVGVDTFGSVIFGRKNAPRQLRGLGNSLVPGNVKHDMFDEVHWLTAAEAAHGCHDLLREKGLFMGHTSGAAYQVARWYARCNPKETVAVIFPDEGYRYLDTVYNDAWTAALPGWGEAVAGEPLPVFHPEQEAARWAGMAWGRRTLEQVLGTL